jgi:hypothetical protein
METKRTKRKVASTKTLQLIESWVHEGIGTPNTDDRGVLQKSSGVIGSGKEKSGGSGVQAEGETKDLDKMKG